ncbi:MAG: DUF308 domain-containing protein [Oscillibacter sp.]|jgi:uncharacterized membrane protein HdeD (DUF308 family)|nr:DUF308 domain-containing protein [Oscillibacter sp.]
MNSFLKKIKTNSLITAALYTVLGVVLLAWPGLSADIFCTVLGAVLVACGVVDILLFLTHRDGSLYSGGCLVLGVILAVVGIYIIVRPALVQLAIPVVVGVLICVHGFVDVGNAVTLRRSGYPRWGTALVLGLLTLALGAVLIFRPFSAFQSAVRVIGVFLLYDGISDIWIVSRVSKTLRQAAKDAGAESGAVDVDYTDTKD